MGIFHRISKLIKSNANQAVDKLSNPAKEVEQLVLEMEEALRKARGETQRGMAAEKLAAGRLPEAEKKVADWGRRAEAAAQSGDDELAKEALERQRTAEGDLGLAQRELRETGETARAQKEALHNLEARLLDVKRRKGTIKSKVGFGKNQSLSQGSLDEFDRMAGNVDDRENRVEAERELAGLLDGEAKDAATEKKFAGLGSGDMDERLAALKKKLEK